jgi:glycerol kinase
MQFQADILKGDVLRPKCIETTALGAAYLAGLAVGYWKDREEIKANWQLSKWFRHRMGEDERQRRLKGWDRAVRCALLYSEEE